MKRILILLLAAPLFAQPSFYLDLSGDWRSSEQDRAAFAEPDFDDSA